MNRFEPVDKPYDAGAMSSPASVARAPTAEDRNAWLWTAGVILIGCLALVWSFRETVTTLIGHWDSAAYNHGYLIVPISLYVVWERRAQIARLRADPTFWALVPALGFAAIWAIGDAVDLNVAKEFGVIGLFQTLIFAILGWRLSRLLMFPILYMWLMLPVGESLYPVLQRTATQLTVFFLSLTSLPVFSEDAIIYVTSGTYRIAEVCAGLNFILATISLSLIYGTMMYRSLIKRFVCVAVMVPIAIVGNGFRIFLIIFANHYLGSHIDIVADHYFYGWGFIGIIFLVMMWVGLFFRDPEPDNAAVSSGPAQRGWSARRAARIVAAAAVIVLASSLAPGWSSYREARQIEAPVVALKVPASLNGQFTQREPANPAPWHPVFPQADDVVLTRYDTIARQNAEVDLFIAYYATQTRNKEVVSSQNSTSDGKQWQLVGGESLVAVVDGKSLMVREDRLRNGNDIRLVWSFFWVGGQMTASNPEAKLFQARGELLGGDRRAAAVVISTAEAGDRAVARQHLQDFLNALPVAVILNDATDNQP